MNLSMYLNTYLYANLLARLLTRLFIFLSGLVIGSFVNVIIYRIPRKESIVIGRSHCVNCGAVLSAAELFPVMSYMLQRGRCKNCGVRISARYPIVELLTACLFISFYIRFHVTFEFFIYSAFFSLLIAVCFIDIEWMIIPNRLVFYSLMIALIAFMINIMRPLTIYESSNPFYPLSGLIPGAVFFFLIHIISLIFFEQENSIGMGDIKILLPIGLILGFRRCFIAVFISIITGGVVGLILVITKIKGRKDPIPFGPFLVIGAYLSLLLF